MAPNFACYQPVTPALRNTSALVAPRWPRFAARPFRQLFMATGACHRRRVPLNKEVYGYKSVLIGSLVDTSNKWELVVASAVLPTSYPAQVELKRARYIRQHAFKLSIPRTSLPFYGHAPAQRDPPTMSPTRPPTFPSTLTAVARQRRSPAK